MHFSYKLSLNEQCSDAATSDCQIL